MNSSTTRPMAAIGMNKLLGKVIYLVLGICGYLSEVIDILGSTSNNESVSYALNFLSSAIELGLWIYITNFLFSRGKMTGKMRAMILVLVSLDLSCSFFDLFIDENFAIIIGIVGLVYYVIVHILLATSFTGKMKAYAIASIVYLFVLLAISALSLSLLGNDLKTLKYILLIVTLIYYRMYGSMLIEKQEDAEQPNINA